jgi:hypothetical protein
MYAQHECCSKLEERKNFFCRVGLDAKSVVSSCLTQNRKTAAADCDVSVPTFYDFRCQIFMGTHKGHGAGTCWFCNELWEGSYLHHFFLGRLERITQLQAGIITKNTQLAMSFAVQQMISRLLGEQDKDPKAWKHGWNAYWITHFEFGLCAFCLPCPCLSILPIFLLPHKTW